MKTLTSEHGAFLRRWLSAALLAIAALVAFNYLVDPYGLLDAPRIEGFNAQKPLAASHVRIVKPYQVIHYKPQTLIAGNSRPEIGIDPANQCWPSEAQPIFNLGLPGASLFMQARVIEHALYQSQVKTIYWGLDFIDFFVPQEQNASPRKPLAFEKRLRIERNGHPNKGYWWQKLVDHFQALASLDALKDSLTTLLQQNNAQASTIRRDGFNPARDYLDIIRWEGQWVLFAQKRKALQKLFSRPGLALIPPGKDTSFAFQNVKQVLKLAQKNHIQVVLFINPYHIDYLRIIHDQGHWQAFEQWKRLLTRLATEYQVPLWDFSLIDPKITEPVPPPQDKKTLMRWFWEPAHYRKALGDLMIYAMIGRACPLLDTRPSFGTPLTPANIEKLLAKNRTLMQRFGKPLPKFKVTDDHEQHPQ